MIPLTVIAGYLGAGKTHLINRVLATSAEPIGICVNDFGELNIDATLIQNRSGATLELTNGCVCCQLTDDLGAALEELRSSQVSRVLIEASGVALPEKIAAYGRNWPGYELHRTYTLVDASNIQRWLNDKYISALARAQMQQADELLITKLDLVASQTNQPWPWMANSEANWQLLPNGPLTHDAVSSLLAPAANNASIGDRLPTESKAHQPNLVASCYAAVDPICPDALRRFLAANPQVVRAKGWFIDTAARPHLLQHVGEQTQIEQIPTEQVDGLDAPRPNGLIFLHHNSTALAFGPLAG